MLATIRKLFLFSTAFILFAFTKIQKTTSVFIEGTVVTANTNTPVKRAHVYVLDGEEEALTNDRGEFKIITWQSLPVTITVEHAEYEIRKIKITNSGQKQHIVLKRK
jgi:CarboxypepD_reg-like domain